MEKRQLQSGAYEYSDTVEEKDSKKKYKAKKKSADLSNKDLQELVYALAKRANLI